MFRRSVVAAMATLLVVGCTPTAPASPSPTPTPTTYLCTPEAGGTPAPCTQAQHEEMLRMDALYAEAETVLRRYVAEVDRQEADWRLQEFTPVFEETTTGAFHGYVVELIRQSREKEIRRVSGPAPLAWVKRAPGISRDGSIVSLESCTDGGQEVYVSRAQPSPTPGGAIQRRFHFARVGEQLKITQSEYKDVEKC